MKERLDKYVENQDQILRDLEDISLVDSGTRSRREAHVRNDGYSSSNNKFGQKMKEIKCCYCESNKRETTEKQTSKELQQKVNKLLIF